MGQSIVVGIDGSRAAVDAALWAVDEAVSRDIPRCDWSAPSIRAPRTVKITMPP